MPPIITVDHLSKVYSLYADKRDRLIEALDPFRRQRHTEFYALRDISFTIEKGESVGIIGVNGSGKSTLLKVLTSVLTPTAGRVEILGRVSALLELGAGFHPERTGRENVYFQGAMQGMRKNEIAAYLPEVIEFADIGDFIDQPVKLYSSGMFVRLAFATAIQGAPVILIVDEALSVGDVRFQRKCFQYIETLKARGITFIFVSHSTEQIVTHCTRALLLSHGSLVLDGEPRVVVNRYLDFLFGRENVTEDQTPHEATPVDVLPVAGKAALDPRLAVFLQNLDTRDRFAEHPLYSPYEYRWGNKEAAILDVYISSSGDPLHIRPGDMLALHVKVFFTEPVIRPIFGCTVKTREGVTIYGSNSEINNCGVPYESVEEGEMAHVTFALRCGLAPGEYFVSLGVARMESDPVPLDRRYDSLLLIVHGPADFFGLADLTMRVVKTQDFRS